MRASSLGYPLASMSTTGRDRQEGRPRARVTAAVLLAALALALLCLRSWRIDYPYSIDFQVYWLAGSRVAQGRAAELYREGGGPDGGTPRVLAAREFKNLPLIAAGFAPLAALDYAAAKRAFWWVGLAALAASGIVLGAWVLPETLGSATFRIAGACALLFAVAPAHTSLRHGQTTPLALLATMGWLAASQRGPRELAGVLLAAGASIKLPLLALAGLDVVRGRWRSVAGWAAAVALTIGLSLILFGPALHRQYVVGLAEHANTVIPGHNNQSLLATVYRLMQDAPSHDWVPRPVPAGAGRAAAAGVTLLTGIVLYALLRSRAQAPAAIWLEFPAAVALGFLALPVAWDHYLLLLVPGIATLTAALHARGLLERPAVAATLGLATAAIVLPTPHALLERSPGDDPLMALLLSHGALGALAVLCLAAYGLVARARVPAPDASSA